MDPIDVEAFRVDAPKQALTKRSAKTSIPNKLSRVSLEARLAAFSAGSAFVPLGQPAAAIIAATLQPDLPGSHVGTGMTLAYRVGTLRYSGPSRNAGCDGRRKPPGLRWMIANR